MNVNEWANSLKRNCATHKARLAKALIASGELVKEDARHQIGHYQLGWKSLAESTVLDKIRAGFATPGDDRPLLRTGEMRDSIECEPLTNGFVVGSKDPVAAYQEFGTSRIPPRPFIGPALFHQMPAIEKKLAKVFMDTVTPKQKQTASGKERVREL